MSEFRKIVESIIQEMAYPSNFDLRYFSTIPTFKDRVAYCKERLKFLGGGSSRITFQVDDKKVLKIAKNSKGIAQNMKEEDWGRNQYGCFAEIYEADYNNHTWIEMELARKATNQDFIKHFGITINELKDILHYIYFQYNNRSNYWFNEEEKTKLDHFFNENIYNGQNEELYNLYHYMLDYQPDRASISDWGAKSNWGVVNRNGEEWLVIIDDGFDEEVSSKYYRG